MIVHGIAALALLALPALVPTIALVGLRPTTIFLVPLVGSLLAAVAAEFELAIGGSHLAWFIVMAVLINVITARRFWSIAHFPRWSAWSWLTVLVVIAAVAWPLQALRSPLVSVDGYAIWTLHALLIYGGHHTLLGLADRVYLFSNPDYPPLVPASGAVAFVSEGHVDIRLAVIVTSVLNACGLGVVACGIVEAVSRKRHTWAKVAVLAIAAIVCLVGSGLAGYAEVSGYADLLWAATAVAAIVFGLILPRAPWHLAVAWLCATVASLTKNEGLTTALMIYLLVCIRYLPELRSLARTCASRVARTPPGSSPEPRAGSARSGRARQKSLTLVLAVPFALAMAAPGLAWIALVRLEGIGSVFFGRSLSGHESVRQRLHPTYVGLAQELHILPVAAGVALVASLALRGSRTRLGLGNPGWLWLVVAGSLGALAFTYLFGALEINWWLRTSVSRTTIFANLALYTDLGVWFVVAVTGDERQGRGPRPAVTEDEVPSAGVAPLQVADSMQKGFEGAQRSMVQPTGLPTRPA